MFHSAVGHRRRTTSDVALNGRLTKPVSTPIQDQPPAKSTLSHSYSFSAEDTPSSEDPDPEQAQNVTNEESAEGGVETAGVGANVKCIVLRKHRSDEVSGTRSLAHQLAASCVDVDNGFWSRRLSTSKSKRNQPKGIEMDVVDKVR